MLTTSIPRVLYRSLASALLAGLVMASCTSSIDERPPRQPHDSDLEMWTVNLEHLLPEHNWRVLLDRMANGGGAPTIVSAQELLADEARTFVQALGDRFGNSEKAYAYRLAPEGQNLVAWRRDIFEAGGRLLWRPYGTPGCRRRRGQVVAVRLIDADEDRSVVVTSLHWDRPWATPCMEKNLGALDAALEGAWPVRDLTIVAGDFNSHPDRRRDPDDPGREALDAGRQADPDCWYRSFSALDPNVLENPRPDETGLDCSADPRYRATADAYYDTVHLDSFDNSGDQRDDLCDQWTSIHGGSPTGTACTDTNGDGLRDRGRIDYVWLRWEDPDGNLVRPSASEAVERIGEASADLVCISDRCSATRYSDHRAVSVDLTWPQPRL